MVLAILASLNLLAVSNDLMLAKKEEAHTGKSKGSVIDDKSPSQCGGDLWVKGLCDPVCEQIFNGITDKAEATKKVNHIFRDMMECDNVCTCICEAVCDEFM